MKKLRPVMLLSAIWFSACQDDEALPNHADLASASHADLAAAPSGCPAAWTAPPSVDPSIAVPADGGSVVLHTAAVGTQNYICSSSSSDGGVAFAWTLVAPAAKLEDCDGTTIGMHTAPTGAANPQWSNSDGSVVVGKRMSSFTGDPNAIPWLLLVATSHSGSGILSNVTFVQRVNTAGGKATDPCDAAHEGATSDVGYSADYYFFAK